MDGLYWKHPIKMDDLGRKPTIFGNTHIGISGTYRKNHPHAPGHFSQIPAGSNLEQLRQGEVPQKPDKNHGTSHAKR